MEEYELISKVTATVGFPILCCVWLATIGRKAIDRLAESNNTLAEALEKFGEAAGKHSSLLERIESKIDRVEFKLEKHAELFLEYKAKTEKERIG